MRSGRVSSFTFACTTLAIALSASASPASVLAPSSALERAVMHDDAAPDIVLTPPTPTPDIGIFRLPVTGMHIDPVPYTETVTTDDGYIPAESVDTPPGAGVRPMSPEAQQKHHGSVAYRIQTAHKDEHEPTPHPLRGDPSTRPHQRREEAAFEATERRDSTGRVHLARVRDFVAKAEYRNRRRSSQSGSTSHAVGSTYRRPSEFVNIDVVSSPDPTLGAKLAEADLAAVNVNLGEGLDVSAAVGSDASGTGEGSQPASSVPISTGNAGSSTGTHAKGKGQHQGSASAKHHGSSSGSKSKVNHKNSDDDDNNDDNNNNNSSNKGSSSGSGSGSGSSEKLAKVTWYSGKHLLNPACGGPSPSDHALVAAVNRNSPYASCGDVLTLTSPTSGRSVTVRIVDWCDTCTANEPWFDITKGAFEKLADLELGVLKGLEFERVKAHAVKDRQRMMNHDLVERRDGQGSTMGGKVAVRQIMERVVRRSAHDDLKDSILGGDFGSSTGSSLFGMLDLLTGGSAPSTDSDPPVSTSVSNSNSDSDSDSKSDSVSDSSHHSKHKSAPTPSPADVDNDDDAPADDDDCEEED